MHRIPTRAKELIMKLECENSRVRREAYLAESYRGNIFDNQTGIVQLNCIVELRSITNIGKAEIVRVSQLLWSL